MAMTETLPFHDWLVELRRHFHQFPELGYQETKTASKIAEELDALGVEYRSGVGQTGLVARVAAKNPGPTVALRADMDALPLSEQNDLPYRSKHAGVMHACGHDGHITIALGVVRYLMEGDWREKGCGRIIFFFQPAEEGGAGARAMIDTGILDTYPIDAIFAGHMHPELPTGHIGLAEGVSNAASNTFRVRIIGKGGHGAHPHLCSDPIVAGASLIVQMQSVISRSISPLDGAVLTVGRFNAGTASNVIPQDAFLEGTLRTLDSEVYEIITGRLREMASGLETAYRVKTELMVYPGYPLLINDPRLVGFIREEAEELLGVGSTHLESPRMGAEDFAYFLQRCPGAMIRLGCHDPEKGFTHGLHSPFFDFDERVLDIGVHLFARLLINYAVRWKDGNESAF